MKMQPVNQWRLHLPGVLTMANFSMGRPGEAAGFKQHEDTRVAEAASSKMSAESLNGLESFNQFRGASSVALSPEVSAMLGNVQIVGNSQGIGAQNQSENSNYNMSTKSQDFSPYEQINDSPYGRTTTDSQYSPEVTGFNFQGVGAPINDVNNSPYNMNGNDSSLPPGGTASLAEQAAMANQFGTNGQALGLAVLGLEMNAIQGFVSGQDQDPNPSGDGGQFQPQIPGQNMLGLPQLGGGSLGFDSNGDSGSDNSGSDNSDSDSDDSDN
jgi:hypothetical protein